MIWFAKLILFSFNKFEWKKYRKIIWFILMRYESLFMIHRLWILIWDQPNLRLAKQKCLIFSSLWLTWTRSRTGTTSITTRPVSCGAVTFVVWTTRPWLTGWWCTSRTWMRICMFFILLKLSKSALFRKRVGESLDFWYSPVKPFEDEIFQWA